jgi:hypothetical protein
MDCPERDRLLKEFRQATLNYVRQEHKALAAPFSNDENRFAKEHKEKAKVEKCKHKYQEALSAYVKHVFEHGCTNEEDPPHFI